MRRATTRVRTSPGHYRLTPPLFQAPAVLLLPHSQAASVPVLSCRSHVPCAGGLGAELGEEAEALREPADMRMLSGSGRRSMLQQVGRHRARSACLLG